jgi:hypothetical protein
VLAKDLVDGVISNLVRYGGSVDNRDLVMLADPIDTARLSATFRIAIGTSFNDGVPNTGTSAEPVLNGGRRKFPP